MRSNFVTQSVRLTVFASFALMNVACAMWAASPFVECREDKYGMMACYREVNECWNFQCRTRRIRVSEASNSNLVAELKVNESAIKDPVSGILPDFAQVTSIDGHTASARVEFGGDTNALAELYKSLNPQAMRTLGTDEEGLTIQGKRYQACEIGASTSKGEVCIQSLQLAIPKDSKSLSLEAPQG